MNVPQKVNPVVAGATPVSPKVIAASAAPATADASTIAQIQAKPDAGVEVREPNVTPAKPVAAEGEVTFQLLGGGRSFVFKDGTRATIAEVNGEVLIFESNADKIEELRTAGPSFVEVK